MTKLDILIIASSAILFIVCSLIVEYWPTYIKVKPTLWERYKQWRLERYWQKQEVKK